jgi:hypothetical protein
MSPFRQLMRLYLDRYYASEALASGSGFEASVYAVLALIATTEIFFSPVGPLFLTAYAFGVTGLATAFEWDMLFPDRRDFLVLTPFPIRMRHLFAAKLASLAIFLSAVMVAVHAYIPFVFFGLGSGHAAGADVVRQLLGIVAATACASVFAFLSVAGFQGICINICGARAYRRISPWLQTFAMCLMVFAVLLFPVYFLAVSFFPSGHANWVWWIPPFWFQGVAAFFSPRPDPALAALGMFGCKALAVAFLVCCLAWAAGYAHHYRRTLEAQDLVALRPGRSRSIFDGFLGSNEARAIFYFTGQTLARSVKHRLFFAAYLSAGLSLGLFVTLTVSSRGISVPAAGLRSLSPLMVFFVVSGFRAAFQFPAELPANWLLRVTESGWGEASRRASRLRAMVSGLLPALVAFVPLEVGRWGLGAGLFHIAVQAVAGMLLIEVLFYSFDKIPFTCSCFPGGLNLIFLAVAYFYGFTSYSFQIADLEAWLESRPCTAALCLAAAAAAWIAIRRFRPGGVTAIRFEGGEPAIRTLELT